MQDDAALAETLANAVFDLVRHLIWRTKMTADEALLVCRAAELTMLLAGDREDFSLALAAEAVEIELTGGLMFPTEYSKSRIVN